MMEVLDELGNNVSFLASNRVLCIKRNRKQSIPISIKSIPNIIGYSHDTDVVHLVSNEFLIAEVSDKIVLTYEDELLFDLPIQQIKLTEEALYILKYSLSYLWLAKEIVNNLFRISGEYFKPVPCDNFNKLISMILWKINIPMDKVNKYIRDKYGISYG